MTHLYAAVHSGNLGGARLKTAIYEWAFTVKKPFKNLGTSLEA